MEGPFVSSKIAGYHETQVGESLLLPRSWAVMFV